MKMTMLAEYIRNQIDLPRKQDADVSESENGLMKQKKTFVEFFAGIGLVRQALESSGWICTYANDIDPKKKAMYEAQFSDSKHFHLGDVWKTKEVVNRIAAKPFLATASFPCTDLSLAGHWRGLKGSESSTYFGFLKAIERLGKNKPTVILLENVTGFLTSNGGKDFPTAVHALAELGYWIDAIVVDAKHFVPQSRQRLFVVGLHESAEPAIAIKQGSNWVLGDPWREAIEGTSTLRPERLVRVMNDLSLPTGWFTTRMSPPSQASYELSSLIDQDESQEWWDDGQVKKHFEMMHDYHRVRVKQMIDDGITFVGTIFRRKRHGAMRAEVRFDGVAGCLRTNKGGSARQIVFVVTKKKLRMRWMSPQEYARLQGATNFNHPSRHSDSIFGFGDAVCVPVVQWIDQTILTPLFSSCNTRRKILVGR